MGRRRHAQRLMVWLNGTPVAQWDASPSVQTLTYLPSWLDDERARPLSLSLPLRASAPYRGDVVLNFFDNLLPDSDANRRRMALHFRTGGTAPYELLAAVGRDCVGAVQLLPPDEEPAGLHRIQGEPLSERDVAGLLAASLADAPLGPAAEGHDLRLSIAGAQEKNALLWHAGQWHRPVGSTPTTHILKLPMGLVGHMQADMRTSVENEWLCARILHAFGLPVAPCGIIQFGDYKTLAVERFDRRLAPDHSWIMRLPQEDFCQATGTSPLHKYQADGGPGIARIMEILLGSEQAAEDRRAFFKTQVIFWLLCATDGHAKNFSIFHLAGSRYRATPLYDILSIHPIIGKGKRQIAPQRARLAMAVRGSANHYQIDTIRRSHWLQQARQVGLGSAQAESIIEEVLDQAEGALEWATADLPQGFPVDVAEAIVKGTLAQARRLREQA